MKNNRDFPLRTAGVAAVIAVLLLVLSILGNVRISGYLKASMRNPSIRSKVRLPAKRYRNPSRNRRWKRLRFTRSRSLIQRSSF